MDKQRQQILDSVLARIARDGWTEIAFKNGVKAAGAARAQADRLFPDGIQDVAAAFHRMINEAMQAKIKAKRNFPAMRVRDKVMFAVRARLEFAEQYREAMRRLLVWSVLPRNIRASTQQLWAAADEIWVAAGDNSTDYNYYTKRILLVAVMKATLAFWLNDLSEGCVETWAFLDRRIEDVMTVGKGIAVARNVGMSGIMTFVRSRLRA